MTCGSECVIIVMLCVVVAVYITYVVERTFNAKKD